MRKNRLVSAVTFTGMVAVFIGCTSGSKKPVTPKNMSETYQKAFKDGCETANGNYTKDHNGFKDNKDYYEGWFDGRYYCEHNRTKTAS